MSKVIAKRNKIHPHPHPSNISINTKQAIGFPSKSLDSDFMIKSSENYLEHLQEQQKEIDPFENTYPCSIQMQSSRQHLKKKFTISQLRNQLSLGLNLKREDNPELEGIIDSQLEREIKHVMKKIPFKQMRLYIDYEMDYESLSQYDVLPVLKEIDKIKRIQIEQS